MLAMTTALTIQTFRTQDRALRLRIQPRAPHIVPQAADWRHLSPGLAMALLLVAGMMWGGGNVASKTVLLHVGPLTTLALRCTLAFAIILALLQPWQRARQSVPFTASFLKSACGVALLFAGALVLQQCAYRWTSVTNASFLVNTCAVLTPVIAWIWLGQRPKASVALAGGAILFGAYLMSGLAGAGSHIGAGINPGDLASLGSAVFYASAMVALGRHLHRHGRLLWTTAIQFAVTALLAAPLALWLESPSLQDVGAAWPELAYLGVFSSAGASVLTAVAQRSVTASVAATITSSESVFGGAAAFVVLGERIPGPALVGGAVILLAILIVARADGTRAEGTRADGAQPDSAQPASAQSGSVQSDGAAVAAGRA